MTPAVGLLTPVKIAFGQWLGQFYDHFVPDTPSGEEWSDRGLPTAMAFVPGRMVDQVEDMMTSWRMNNNATENGAGGKPGTSAFVPVVLVAVAPDYTESPAEHGRPISSAMMVSIPGDARKFKARLMFADIRAQVCIVANESTTATSIAAQLALWAIEVPTFHSSVPFAGHGTQWPVKVLGADRIGIPTPSAEKVTILAVDFTLRATLPILYGSPTDSELPTGFPVVNSIVTKATPSLAPPAGVTQAAWEAFRRMTGSRQPDVQGRPESSMILKDIDDESRAP